MGHLHCVQVTDGTVVWRINLQTDFGPTSELTWGTCGSPVLADGRLIVSPGVPAASVAALDPATGEVLWKTSGAPFAYGSLLSGNFGGVPQVIGHDQASLGGWGVKTGQRLWSLKPFEADDFNVPTPVAVGQHLLVSSENNGTRLYAFGNQGRIIPQPLAINEDVAPDTATPVIVGNRVYALFGSLYCLSLDGSTDKLSQLWQADDRSFATHGSLIGSADRLLVAGASGDVLLLDATEDQLQVISRMTVFDDGDAELYAHPALVGDRLYMRGAREIVGVRISMK